jgi:poly(hydroxyalkanoate) granule-associated protein
MAKQKLDVGKLQEDLFSSTRRVWLAGLGVLSTVEKETQSLFTELVERGKKVETRGKKSWNKTRKEIESTTDEIGEKLDNSVSEVLQRMGVPSRSQVEELTNRVEKLTGQVERLAAKPTKSRTRKAPAKNATAKKAAAKKKAA